MIHQQWAPILYFHPREGEFCCYPSDAEDAYSRIKTNAARLTKSPTDLQSPPCYFQVSEIRPDFKRLRYWIWYNFNDFPAPDIPLIPELKHAGDHLGDWENIEILLQNDHPYVVFYSNHSSARRVFWSHVIKAGDLRPLAWVALGSHAHYESPDISPLLPPDQVAGEGLVWDTKNWLVDVTTTSFYQENFLGDWGVDKKIFGPPARKIEENGP